MSVPRRPGRGETDEELLKFQEEFLAKQEKPSVHIIKKKYNSENGSSQITDTSANKQPVSSKCISDPVAGPIPGPSEGTSTSSEGNGPSFSKKKSLFALRMEKSRVDASRNSGSIPQDKNSSQGSKFGDQSYIIHGKEAEEIHKQNVAQLEKLSVNEIEEERLRLMSQLSSSTIKFLQSRRKHNQNIQTESETMKPTPIANDEADVPSVKTVIDIRCGLPSESKPSAVLKESTGRKKVFSNSLTSSPSPSQSKEPETDLLATLPINPDEAKQWLHMNIVEKDKLEWMKDLPPARKDPSPDEPYAARFDFQGLLLPFNDDKLNVNQGLHHHGDEPERPGYTLQELMQLSRSSVLQQRVMGLSCLGNVLLKAQLGIYDKVLQQNIVKEMLDASIFLLLRFSMDDISPPVVFAATTAMRNLLFNEPDEASLDYFLGCEGGLQHPTLEVPYEETDAKKIQEQMEHEAELKDFEIIQLDVLRGAERTNLISRLGYILDVLKGPPDVVLDLLLRIARHSRQLAEAVVNCGGLLRTIRDQLLTTRVIPALAAGSGQLGYGEPSSKALRLMRVLAGHSRTIANTLLDKFNIMEPVMTYVSMSSPELPHIQGLVIQGYYLWQTFMSYGLASQSVVDLFPILMRQLHFHVQHTSPAGPGASSSGHELATALIGVIERACDVILSDHNVLDCKPVFQLAKLALDCQRKWLTQVSSQSSEMPNWSGVKLIGATFNCLASVANCAAKQDLADSKTILEKIESLVYEVVLPFVKSTCLQSLLDNLVSCSYFLSSCEVGTKRDPPNLPSLGAMEWGGVNLLPGLLPHAPHPTLSGLLRFLGVFSEAFGSVNKLQSLLLENNALDKYIEALVTEPLRSSSHWFCRQEVYMLHHLVVLIVLQPSLVPSGSQMKYSQLAFRVVDMVQANDKYLITTLLPITIFSPEFIRWGMAMIPKTTNCKSGMIEESLERLSFIGSHYLNVLNLRFCKVPPPSQRMSLTCISKGTEPALPVDWHFAPLLVLYGQYDAQNRARCSERDTTLVVTETLQFLFLIESLWPKARRPLSVTARWCRLALVFLAGSDLFLDSDVKQYLRLNLDQLLLQRNKLNFREKIPGLSSFYDLYGELLLQFSAVSYGDTLFGAFLLLPLQQKQDPQLRRMIWGENAVVLHLLSTPIEEVGVPIEEFLEPCEKEPSLLSCYLDFVAKGRIVERRCPVLYRVAVHHVSSFIKTYPNHPFATLLNKKISQIGNKSIQQLFLK